MTTVAEFLIDALAERGTKRLYGVPGGGNSLDLIDAAGRRGVDFVLAQTETAAAIMAAVGAEISGTPGAVLVGVGPGAASVVNGVAYASLEQAPLVVLTDKATGPHQDFDQPAMFAPLCKEAVSLEAGTADRDIPRLVDLALARPFGPVHLDFTAALAMTEISPSRSASPIDRPDPDEFAIARARSLLAAAERPVIAAGLEARDAPAAAALGRLARDLGCPVLTTYKGKGAFPDADPLSVGHVTGGTLEGAVLRQADLFLFYGLDPIEIVNRPQGPFGAYETPVLELAAGPRTRTGPRPTAVLTGPLEAGVAALRGANSASRWTPEEIGELRRQMAVRFAQGDVGDADPRSMVAALRSAAEEARESPRLAVDSGAHMFPAMAGWAAERPYDVLKSNGLSTMGFALPAAIGAALEDPDRPALALIGDGGLMMCLGELETARRLGCRVVTVVFNDASLALIDLKQRNQGRESRGVRYPRVDFAALARGFGMPAHTADTPEALRAAAAEAIAGDGPALIDVAVDAGAYAAMLDALRG